MKTKIVAVVITSLLLSFGSLLADEAPPGVTKADLRLLKTDLNILFEQYKKAKTLLAELDFQAGLSEAQGNKRTQQEEDALKGQRRFLQEQVLLLRDQIKEMGQQAAKMERPKEKNNSEKKHDS
jgi:hypothetical protein